VPAEQSVPRQEQRRPIWQLIALAALFAVTLYIRGPLLIGLARPAHDELFDFYQEWASARNVLDGYPVYESQRVSAARYLDFHPNDDKFFVEVNAHPPTTVLLTVPLGWLDYSDAALVWNALSLAALVASGWIIKRQLGVRLDAWQLLLLAITILWSTPIREQIRQGQLNLLLLLLVTGAWAADRNDRPALAGILVGTAAVIKLFPAFMFIYFLVRRQWRAVCVGVAWGLALTALTAAALGTETYVTYVRDVLPQVREWRSGWDNASVPAFFAKLFDPGTKHSVVIPIVRSPLSAQVGTFLASAVIVALVAWRTWQGRSRTECDGAYAAAVVAMLLLAPMTWEHAFVIAALPLSILTVCWSKSSWQRRALLVITICLCIGPTPLIGALFPEQREGWFRYGTKPALTLVLFSIHFYTLIALFALTLMRAPEPNIPRKKLATPSR
jgi:hypothetical protein